jgi:hypothetical protein
MKGLIKTIFKFEVEYGIVSFYNYNFKNNLDFFEPTNVVIFPDPNMRPNDPNFANNNQFNINFRYFIIKSIKVEDYENKGHNRTAFNIGTINDYIAKYYIYTPNKYESKFKTETFTIESDIPYYEAQVMMEDNEDIYRKKLVRKVYENTIDDISSRSVKDVSIGRLLRLYNEPIRENAVYNTSRCGFSVVIKMTDESYLDKVLNIFNKVDYGFIKSQIMKEEYTEIGVFIYSKDKLSRELDIQKVKQFIKGYLKCFDDSIEILRFDVLNTKDDVIYHKFNLTGHDNEVFGLHGENVGFSYFKFTDKSDYNLAENIYEQVDEFEKVVEYGNVPNPGNRVIITLEAGIKNGITPRDCDGIFTELYDIKLLENASFIPEKYSYIKKLFNEYKPITYKETILYNGKILRNFGIDPGFFNNPEEEEYFSWFRTALTNLYRRLCFIDHTYKNQLFYGPFLNNMSDFIKFEFANPIRTSREEAPELTRVFFNVKLKPYINKNVKPDQVQQGLFEEVIKRIMDKKITISVPDLAVYEDVAVDSTYTKI